MKKIFLCCIMLAFGLISPGFSQHIEKKISGTVQSDTHHYNSQRNKDYWTRVWYEKQAKKGIYYKNHVYKKKKYKKRASKKRYSSRSGRIIAKVDLSTQRMNVFRKGTLLHSWKVSTGRKGYRTPTGTWRIHRMHREYYSKKYDNAPMPHAMFFYRGFAIHGTNSIKRLGNTASHGCVRLHPDHAARLFSMVKRFGGTVKVTY